MRKGTSCFTYELEQEISKLTGQNEEMLDQLKRYKNLVKEYDLDDDEELLIEMEFFIIKVGGE